ncbi:hypothetical protein [Cupriavidus necator]
MAFGKLDGCYVPRNLSLGRAVYPANGWGDFLNISAISARHNGHKEGQYCSDIV